MLIGLSILVCWPSVKAGKAGCPSAVDYMTTWCDNVQSKPSSKQVLIRRKTKTTETALERIRDISIHYYRNHPP